MDRKTEKGVALILTLFLVLVLSVMGVSLMFLSQTESWSSMNYRLMSQARDAAEAGVNASANYLINGYTPPSTGGTDPLTGYSSTAYPVNSPASGTNPVILSASSSQTANYPVSSVKSAFSTAGQGSLTAGFMTINYNSWAELLYQAQVQPFGCASLATCGVTLQTWRITSEGTISSIRNAKVEISAMLERQVNPVFSYAAFATSCADGVLNFSGGANTDSYDSTTLGGTGPPQTDNNGGDVGTNGSLNASGGITNIYGSLSTPRNGVGSSSCLTGAQVVLTGNANQLHGGILELPQVIAYPTPQLPNPLPPTTTYSLSGACGSLAGCTQIGTVSEDKVNIAPGLYGNMNITGGTEVHLSASPSTCTSTSPCVYNVNSLSLAGNSKIFIDGPTILNIAGCSTNNGTSCTSYITAPLDLTGGTVTNWPPISSNFQITYAGTGTLKLAGGSNTSGLVYAPNATIQLYSNNGHWYGAMIGTTVSASGGVTIDYDRSLANNAFTIGNWMLSKFNWKRN